MKGSSRAVLDVIDALGSGLTLTEVLPRAREAMSKLIASDHMALCVSRRGRPTEYDWFTAMPKRYFDDYEKVAPEDFVRRAVISKPGSPLRDSEILSRLELKRSLLYNWSRELGMPLERVMSVYLPLNEDCHGGVTLYRDRPRPFSDRELHFFQSVVPHWKNAIRNCRDHEAVVANKSDCMEGLSDLDDIPLPEPWRLRLTPKECEVAEGMLRDWEDRVIAEHCGKAVGTVKVQVKSILKKLGLENRKSLIRNAFRHYKSHTRGK